jgi:hypothetical protein
LVAAAIEMSQQGWTLEDDGQRHARLAAENGPEWCASCEMFTGHLLAGNLCANCRNAALREASA